MTGLLNRKSIGEKQALVITQCQSIHMFFMRFSIDVIFVNDKNKVVGLVERIRPFCLSKMYFKASYAIELAEGAIARTKTSVGDNVKIEKE